MVLHDQHQRRVLGADDRPIAQLEAENALLRRDVEVARERLERCVEVTTRKLDRLNLLLAHHKVSVDATGEAPGGGHGH